MRGWTLYDWRWKRKRGEVRFDEWWKLVGGLGKLGGVLVMVGVIGVGWVATPVVMAEMEYRLNSKRITNDKLQITKIVEPERPSWEVPDEHFSVYVPKIGAVARVVGNVDPGDKKVYAKALKEGVAHAAGSSLPGRAGGTFLFAHSVGASMDVARYNAVFYLLRELGVGDEVEMVFEGRLYRYKVAETHVVEANDISWLSRAAEGPERVILQTCWPPGTTWKRLVVVAKRY